MGRSLFKPDSSDKTGVFLYNRYGPWWFFRARLYWASVGPLSKFFPHVIWGLVGVFLGVTPIYDYCRDEFDSLLWKLNKWLGNDA